MNFTQRLHNFRKKRIEVLSKTKVADADDKIPRMDSIEHYYLHGAWREISDNLQRYYY